MEMPKEKKTYQNRQIKISHRKLLCNWKDCFERYLKDGKAVVDSGYYNPVTSKVSRNEDLKSSTNSWSLNFSAVSNMDDLCGG
jgi:hypothetical protein